jgi:MFS family permease
MLKIFPDNKEVREFETGYLLKIIGKSLVGIFIPLYLLNLGYSLSMVMVFYGIASLVMVATVLLAAKFCAKFGSKKSIILSTFFYIAYYGGILFLPAQSPLIFVIPIIYGLSEAFYWIPFHSLFAIGLDRGRVGKQNGLFSALENLTAAFGPILGGALITFTGFNTPFLIALCFLIASLVPLFISKDFNHRRAFSMKHNIRRFDLRYFITFFGGGVGARADSLWPIFIFFFISSYIFVGGLSTFSLIVATLSMLFAGWIYDRLGLRMLYPISAFALGALNILRAFVRTAFQIVGLDVLSSVAGELKGGAHAAAWYENARESGDPVSYVVLREIFIHSGMAFFNFAFAIVFMFFPRAFSSAFIIGGLANLLFLVLVRKKPILLRTNN